jgi:hypothetical protein
MRVGCSSLCGLLACLVAPAALAQSATVTDPEGDAVLSKGRDAPAGLDILSSSFVISDALTLTVEVAGPLAALTAPEAGAYFWSFPLDTDPSTSVAGYPWPPHQATPPEFVAIATLDETGFRAELWDRRPSLSGGEVLRYPIPVSVSDSSIMVTVPAELAAEAQAEPGARWRSFSGWWPTADREHGNVSVDFVDSIDWQSWPQ